MDKLLRFAIWKSLLCGLFPCNVLCSLAVGHLRHPLSVARHEDLQVSGKTQSPVQKQHSVATHEELQVPGKMQSLVEKQHSVRSSNLIRISSNVSSHTYHRQQPDSATPSNGEEEQSYSETTSDDEAEQSPPTDDEAEHDEAERAGMRYTPWDELSNEEAEAHLAKAESEAAKAEARMAHGVRTAEANGQEAHASYVKEVVAIFCLATIAVFYTVCSLMLFMMWRSRSLTPPDAIVRQASLINIGEAAFMTAGTYRLSPNMFRSMSEPASSIRSSPQNDYRDILPPVGIPEEPEPMLSPSSSKQAKAKDMSKASIRSFSGSVSPRPGTVGSDLEDHITIPGNELIQIIGVSGMCAFPTGEVDSISHVPEYIAVPVLFLQAACLQVSLLYYMWVQLSPREDDVHSPPRLLTFVAIYLHFLSCAQEIPYSIQIFRYFIDFHDDVRDILCFGFVVVADGFVIPFLCFVLGALYLCTSGSVADVILKAVSVSFVTEIDAWIISLAVRAGALGGNKRAQAVRIPVSPKSMRALMISFVYCPIIPAGCSLLGVWVGRTLLSL